MALIWVGMHAPAWYANRLLYILHVAILCMHLPCMHACIAKLVKVIVILIKYI